VLKTCFENAPEAAHGFMDGLSMHYYVHPEGWEIKGSATEFDDKVWYKTLAKALYIETLIKHHTTIMDKYDPEKKIGLICDEWGTWFTCEPGTNPGFLYQQSTMRDALVAGLSLNVFNKHCDRVKMANIAQLINVLQAVILTDGPKMIKTPTYYVFHMYKYHQDAELVESYIDGVKTIGEEKEYMVPNLQESVSIDKDGVITITVNNLSVTDSEHMDIAFTELKPSKVTASILTNKMDAYNTFENPEVVKEEEFTGYTVSENGISFEIPACSVVQFRVK
jgi:alpha-N-arabinofuranosidase